MKPFKSVLLAIISSFISLSSFSLQAEPLVWKATKGQQQLMLLGTVHIADKSMYPLPKQVDEFLKTSNGLVLEVDLKGEVPEMDFPNTLRTIDVVNLGQFKKITEFANKYGLNQTTLMQFPPWLTAVVMEQKIYEALGYDFNLGVDIVLQEQAESLKVPLLAFESISYQMNLMQTLPEGGADLLLDYLNDENNNDAIRHCLIQDWSNGNEKGLLDALSSANWSDEVENILLYERNKQWATKIQDPQFLSPSGQYLIAVGTLHLVGKGNLLEYLTQQGYNIELITKSQQVECAA